MGHGSVHLGGGVRAPRSMCHSLLCSSTRCTCLDSSICGRAVGLPAMAGQRLRCRSRGNASSTAPRRESTDARVLHPGVPPLQRVQSTCPSSTPCCSHPTTPLLPLGRPLSLWGTAFVLASDPVISRSFSFLGLGPQGTPWGLGVIWRRSRRLLVGTWVGGYRACRAGVMVTDAGSACISISFCRETGCGQRCMVLGSPCTAPWPLPGKSCGCRHEECAVAVQVAQGWRLGGFSGPRRRAVEAPGGGGSTLGQGEPRLVCSSHAGGRKSPAWF